MHGTKCGVELPLLIYVYRKSAPLPLEQHRYNSTPFYRLHVSTVHCVSCLKPPELTLESRTNLEIRTSGHRPRLVATFPQVANFQANTTTCNIQQLTAPTNGVGNLFILPTHAMYPVHFSPLPANSVPLAMPSWTHNRPPRLPPSIHYC
jgi:hypothetical protein